MLAGPLAQDMSEIARTRNKKDLIHILYLEIMNNSCLESNNFLFKNTNDPTKEAHYG